MENGLIVKLPGSDSNDIELRAPSMSAALTVARINLSGGTAEIYDGDRRLASVRMHGEGNAAFWEIC